MSRTVLLCVPRVSEDGDGGVLDWRGVAIDVARSEGGVLALANPWENLIRSGVTPWPPPELIQKLYRSRQVRAFRGADATTATRALGFYSDLQSMHSEDAATWSVFGPVAYSAPGVRTAFAHELLTQIAVPVERVLTANIWLWRRLPHPDTLVPGGPEIDFGIQTDDVFLLGEAKWLSSIAVAQGAHRDRDQIALRREFCARYGPRILPACRRFVVLGVSLRGGVVPVVDDDIDGVTLHSRDITWEDLGKVAAHPRATEVRDYLSWKQRHLTRPRFLYHLQSYVAIAIATGTTASGAGDR